MNRLFRPFLCIVVFSSILFASNTNHIKVIQQSETDIRLLFNFDDIKIEHIADKGTSHSKININTSTVIDPNYDLSYSSTLLHLESNQAHAELLSSQTKFQSAESPKINIDTALGMEASITPNTSNHTLYPNQPVQLEYQGLYKNNHLWVLKVYPAQYDFRKKQYILHNEVLVNISVQPDRGNSKPIPNNELNYLNSFSELSFTKTQKANPLPVMHKNAVDNHPKIKLLVQEDGIYHISGKYLKEQEIDIESIDMHKLKLTCNGESIPVFVHGWEDGNFDEKDYFEFWGEFNRQTLQSQALDYYQDPYTTTAVYWLTWHEKGYWMPEENGQINEANLFNYIRPYSFHETVHVESDRYYDRLSSMPMGTVRDKWFFDSGISAGKKRDYKFELHHPDRQAPEGVYPQVIISGRTMTDSLSHMVSVFLNDSYLFDGKWHNQNYIDLQIDGKSKVTGADLKNGTNTLSISNMRDANDYDLIMLNWFEISYPRLFRAQDGYLQFKIPREYDNGHFLFRIDGFATEHISIYKIGHSKIVGSTTEEYTDFDDYTSIQASFQDNALSKDIEYIAVEDSAKLEPIQAIFDEPSQLKSPQNKANYVIISHPRFYETESLDNLLAMRQSQGYHALKISTEDIFDEFGYGRPSGDAIKSFLDYAYHNWQEPQLKYVVLVGDGCYQRISAAGDTLDLVPTVMRQTEKFGAAASDHWYTLLEGEDELPDIHIGRLPIREEEELVNFTTKLIKYETEPPVGPWKNSLLLIGGNDDTFRGQGLTLAQKAPDNIDLRMLYTKRDESLEYDPFFGGTSDLIDYFDDGCAMMAFHGHGGGAIWADNGLLRLEDAERIYSEGKHSIVLSFTCFTGSFEAISRESLSDALLFTTQEGPIAWLGASGVGWTYAGYYFQTQILNYFYENRDKTLGEIISAGKIRYYTKYSGSPQAIGQINQYHLLGDPATKLVYPSKSAHVLLDNKTPQQGESLTVNANTPFTQGTGYFTLVDSLKRIHTESQATIINGAAQGSLYMPTDFSSQSGHVRFYATNELGTDQVNGSTRFNTTGVLFDSSRAVFTADDSVYFMIKITSHSPITNAFCRFNRDTLKVEQVENNWFKSESATYASPVLNFSFTITLENGETFKSALQSYTVGTGHDFTVRQNSLKLTGDALVTARVMIDNIGEGAGIDIPVALLKYDTVDSTWQEIRRSAATVGPYSFSPVDFIFKCEPGTFDFRVEIDPDTLYKENNRWNNVQQSQLTVNGFTFLPNIGFDFGNSITNDSLTFEDMVTFIFSKDALSEQTAVWATPQPITIFEQPDFEAVNNIPSYKVLGSKNVQILSPIKLSFKIDQHEITKADSTGRELSIYRLNPISKKWLKLESERSDSTLSAYTTNFGQFAVLKALDTQPPTIDVSINGQPYSENRYISPKPEFFIVLQDMNGIDVTQDKIKIALDGRALTTDDYTMPDSVLNGNQIELKINPELVAGEHSLSLQTTDCNGNTSLEKELYFKIAQNFEIQMLGTYPNPFIESTIFSYLLTFPCEKVNLKIFTASGRLIREINPVELTEDPNPLTADYHEIFWDGADGEGYEVANGVYFYQLQATSEGKTKKVTGKIAKLK